MDSKDIVQIAGALCTVIASLAVSRHQVSKHEVQIEAHAEWLGNLETSTALLKQKQDSHTEQIDQLMRDLRGAIDRLQNIALDLAGIPARRN